MLTHCAVNSVRLFSATLSLLLDAKPNALMMQACMQCFRVRQAMVVELSLVASVLARRMRQGFVSRASLRRVHFSAPGFASYCPVHAVPCMVFCLTSAQLGDVWCQCWLGQGYLPVFLLPLTHASLASLLHVVT